MPLDGAGKEIWGSIYMIAHISTGRVYIGQTVQSISRRWSGHVYGAKGKFDCHIDNAIAKYGVHQFRIEELATYQSQQALDQAERAAILIFSANDKRFGFNLRSGGSRGKHSEETKRKISIANKGREISMGVRERISATLKGRKLPQSHGSRKGGRRAWNRGMIMSAEYRAKLSQSHIGLRQSPETILKRVETTRATFSMERSARLSAAANRRWHPQEEK